jgi:hypothetical protein
MSELRAITHLLAILETASDALFRAYQEWHCAERAYPSGLVAAQAEISFVRKTLQERRKILAAIDESRTDEVNSDVGGAGR